RVQNADAFVALLEAYTPNRVAAVSGIDPDRLTRLASQLKEQGPAIIVVDPRSLAYSNGVETALAAFALDAVLGGRGAPLPRRAPLREWPGTAAVAPLPRETLPDLAPPQVLLLHHANPAYARPQPKRWAEWLAKIPHVVSFSPYLDETVDRFAELVLPDH